MKSIEDENNSLKQENKEFKRREQEGKANKSSLGSRNFEQSLGMNYGSRRIETLEPSLDRFSELRMGLNPRRSDINRRLVSNDDVEEETSIH